MSRKDYEDFINKIRSHVVISCEDRSDPSYLMKHAKEPHLELPNELSESESNFKMKFRLWELEMMKYSNREDLIKEGRETGSIRACNGRRVKDYQIKVIR